MKMVICDIDARMNEYEGKSIIDSINKFIRRGNMVIICTDKAINYIADTFSLTNIDVDYYICNSGGVIFDKYYNVLYRKDLRQELVRPILNILEDDENMLEAFIDTTHGFVKDTRVSANAIIGRPFNKTRAEVLLNSIVYKYPSIHGHVNDNLLIINDIDVDYSNSIDYLLDTYKLKIDDIYVLGSDNTYLDLMKKYKGYNQMNCSDDIKKYSNGEFKDIEALINHLINEEERMSSETVYF